MQGDNPFAAKELVGGALCLDFANTVGQHEPERLNEWLGGYADLVWWGLKAGALQEETADTLLSRARGRPDAAEEVFERGVALREAIYRIFSTLPRGEGAPEAELAVLNRELGRALPHLRLNPGDACCAWSWEGDDLDRVLWPVVRSAAEILTSGDLARIGECAGESCQWLYLDTSRNHSRRWCVMADCGNRAKAKRHYHRSRSSAE